MVELRYCLCCILALGAPLVLWLILLNIRRCGSRCYFCRGFWFGGICNDFLRLVLILFLSSCLGFVLLLQLLDLWNTTCQLNLETTRNRSTNSLSRRSHLLGLGFLLCICHDWEVTVVLEVIAKAIRTSYQPVLLASVWIAFLASQTRQAWLWSTM